MTEDRFTENRETRVLLSSVVCPSGVHIFVSEGSQRN